ncbi:hypothetical protein ACI6Q2_07945 [Chitinophagaceae bacterium LWZ2-11]
MKRILFIALAMGSCALVKAQTKITPEEAIKHVGEKVTVCGKVFDTRYLESANKTPTFLNVGAKYPASPLTVVIWGDDRKNFKDAPEKLYANKNICITGEVKEFKGKAEIIVTKPEDITVD